MSGLHSASHKLERMLGDSTGCDAMQKASDLAETDDSIHIVGADDASFSSSMLVLAEHKTEKEYMGTSVYYIPQNSNKGEIVDFFLYGSHLMSLIDKLEEIKSTTFKLNDGHLNAASKNAEKSKDDKEKVKEMFNIDDDDL